MSRFGQYKTINYRTDFLEFKSVFANWEFTNLDFDKIPLRETDFIYADPPYDVEFTHYSKGGFGWTEQVRTAEWLAKHPGPVVLSNQATKRITDLYRDLDYKLNLLDAPRRISSQATASPPPKSWQRATSDNDPPEHPHRRRVGTNRPFLR